MYSEKASSLKYDEENVDILNFESISFQHTDQFHTQCFLVIQGVSVFFKLKNIGTNFSERNRTTKGTQYIFYFDITETYEVFFSVNPSILFGIQQSLHGFHHDDNKD